MEFLSETEDIKNSYKNEKNCLTEIFPNARIHKLSLQTRGGKYLENQRSNNTQTLKILKNFQ